MSAIPDEAKEFMLRVALHDTAQLIVCSSALLMAGAHVSHCQNLRAMVGAQREGVLEAIRLLKLLEGGEAGQ
jgi:hypothetical protein